jgi:Cof subfamily protein (haloacid dehalogenase superfamily)
MNKLFLALDIDGTIAQHDGHIAPETIDAINTIRSFGHHIVLASGRSFEDMSPILTEVGLSSEWVVSTNGAVIFKNMDKSLYNSEYVPTEILEILPDKHLNHFKNVAPHANFVLEVADEGFYYDGVFNIPYTDKRKQQEMPLDELYGRTCLRLVVTDHISNGAFWQEEIKRYGEGIIGYHEPTENVWLELLHPEADKAYALEKIRKIVDIPKTNVVAIGDGHNDIKMLHWAKEEGLAFAMGQAHDDIKKAANRVTDRVEDLGVAKAILSLLD